MQAHPAPDPILEYFRERTDELLALLEELVSFDTPTGHADLVAAFVSRYRSLLEDAGMRTEEIADEVGPHLFAERLPARETRPPIVIVGHADTVWPRGEVARRPPRIENGRLYAPGVYDMRAGLCLAVAVARYLSDQNVELPCRLQVFVAADEEEGSLAAHPHMERLLERQAVALVPEPPGADGSIKAERKGVGLYRAHLEGCEAHAGVEPERGASAVHEMARRIVAVTAYADPAKGITVNVGEARGGTVTNVVAGRASFGIDVRFDRREDGEALHRRLLAMQPDDPGVRLAVEGGIIFPPLEANPRNRELAEKALAVARAMHLDFGREKSGGGSDGSFLSALGLGVVDGLGVEGGGAHALDEHIRIDRLPVRAAFLTRLVVEIAGGEHHPGAASAARPSR